MSARDARRPCARVHYTAPTQWACGAHLQRAWCCWGRERCKPRHPGAPALTARPKRCSLAAPCLHCAHFPSVVQLPNLDLNLVGRLCPDSSCKECCETADCPNAAQGQTCIDGRCTTGGINGCATFTSCWTSNVRALAVHDGASLSSPICYDSCSAACVQAADKNVCNKAGNACISCDSPDAMRCPAGWCCDGNNGCARSCSTTW